jgi:hypothetical protein
MATLRICYKDANGKVICYDAPTMTSAQSADRPRPKKEEAGVDIEAAIKQALRDRGDREMQPNPEFISITYYAE